MAALWIHEFVKLSGNAMLPHMPGILMAQLPNLVFDDERRRSMTEDQYKRKLYKYYNKNGGEIQFNMKCKQIQLAHYSKML